MAKGHKTGGRPAGIPNKVTTEVRQIIAGIAERNAPKVEAWLAEIEDPAKRVDMFLRMIEYHIPKLGRTEMTGPNGDPLIPPMSRNQVIDSIVDMVKGKPDGKTEAK